jgi:hypothetical protein
MSHRSVRRGTAVMTLVLALVLAGAGPAHAAQGPRAFEAAWSWLTGLWQAVTGDPGAPPPNPDRGAGLDPDGGSTAALPGDSDRGAGLDPDGRN